MEKVLIVAKTHVYNGLWCVGALGLSSNQSLRLLTQLGSYQPQDTFFKVGQVWEISWRREYHTQPPHVEDVRVLEQKYVGLQTDLRELLQRRGCFWSGSPEKLYNGRLVLTGSAAYICRSMGLPTQSTGFWQPDTALHLSSFRGRPYYSLEYEQSTTHTNGVLRLPYVGEVEPIAEIPASALIRVSLARWWKKYEEEEKKCYLQLSGWYL